MESPPRNTRAVKLGSDRTEAPEEMPTFIKAKKKNIKKNIHEKQKTEKKYFAFFGTTRNRRNKT